MCTDRNDTITYFNYRNPYPVKYFRPEKGAPFVGSLPKVVIGKYAPPGD